MDTVVPSQNQMNIHFPGSPQSMSIYEQEQPCWKQPKIKNIDMSSLSEESGLLDDAIEDSSLNNFLLTPELLSTMASSSSGMASSNLWDNKSSLEEMEGPSVDLSFVTFNVESDPIISDFLYQDSNDSKFSYPPFDFDFKSFQSNPSSSCHTPIPTESKTDLMETSKDTTFPSSNTIPTKDCIGNDFLQKRFPINNFPPRISQPPIGVVSPVKVSEQERKQCSDHFHAKNTKECGKILKGVNFTGCTATDLTELSPQTVPCFDSSNQKMFSVKSEPIFPECSMSRNQLKRRSCDDISPAEAMTSTHGDSLLATRSKRKRYDSGSSAHMSEDGDEEDNDNLDDDSDDDLDDDLAHMNPGECESLLGHGKKQKQYFWQYNVQAKGPKGTRLKLAVESPADPHVLNGFEDPVFDEGNTMLAGIRHGGKARKGDGNEVTPNPHKLFKIGHQLLRLNKRINACQLGSDVPEALRNESRKEKNKLASRACRLKKKAQHEANKIKLHGLETEHGQINNVLRFIWPALRERAKQLQNQQITAEKPCSGKKLTDQLADHISANLKGMVAGHTTEYVNQVILAVEKGDLRGGLNIKKRKT